MKVSVCERCEHYIRKVWSQYYVPNNYHPIGFSHAYAFCKKYNKRCLDVKQSICKAKMNNGRSKESVNETD